MNTFEEFWHYHSETSPDRRAGTADSGPPPGLEPTLLAIEEEPIFQISFNTERFSLTIV